MTYAVHDGYGGLLVKGLFPTYSIFLEVDPARLDVNVHPSKREVRFADERTVYRVLAEAVRAAIREVDLIPDAKPGGLEQVATPAWAPSASSTVPGDPTQTLPRTPAGLVAERPAQDRRQAYFADPIGLDTGPQIALPLTVRRPANMDTHPSQAPEGDPLIEEDPAQVSVWQLHRRYILAHIKNGVIIIDQHVAHERILYEQALDQFHDNPGTGQRLLFPLTLDFGLAEIQVVREAMLLLEKIGFGIRDFGGNTVVVDAIPVDLEVWGEGKLLREVVQDLIEAEGRSSAAPGQNREISPLEHGLAVSYAAHTAIRSGDALSTKGMQVLIDRLFATREPFVSPRDRPIVVKMSLDEIDQYFGR
jgi:DNA mismatch repair protein MutL